MEQNRCLRNGQVRLEEAVGTEKANLIGNNYERNLYNIKKNGSLNFKVLNNQKVSYIPSGI